jgi:hypothetical protein
MYFNYAGKWSGGHDSMGAVAPTTEWYFAEGCTGYSIQEYLCLQNPHSKAVGVTVRCMMKKGEVLERVLQLPPNSRTTVDLNMSIGFHGCSDMVAVHPYKMPPDWGKYYANVVNTLRSRLAWQEVVVTEAGWPHYSDNQPGAYSEQQQADALDGWGGISGLLQNGCRKIWVYRLMDEDPGTSWDGLYFGLFDYQGNPLQAWSVFKNWQQTYFPSYPNLPSSLPSP